MSEPVRPDAFTKWVLGISATVVTLVSVGVAKTLWSVNSTQVELVTKLEGLDKRVEANSAQLGVGPRVTTSDLQVLKEEYNLIFADMLERMRRLEDGR